LYVSGVVNFAILLFGIRVLFLKKVTDRIYVAIFLYIVSLLIISLNPFVGPRYQLPVTAILLSYFLDEDSYNKKFKKYFCISLLCSMLAIPIYHLTIGYPEPSSTGAPYE
jgi:hypothetical protein